MFVISTHLNTWYDWLINYIPESIKKNVGGSKGKVVTLFKTNTPKQTVYGRGKKLSKPKPQKQSEENVIKIIRNLFTLKKKIKKLKIEQLEILGPFLNKKMIVINRKE